MAKGGNLLVYVLLVGSYSHSNNAQWDYSRELESKFNHKTMQQIARCIHWPQWLMSTYKLKPTDRITLPTLQLVQNN